MTGATPGHPGQGSPEQGSLEQAVLSGITEADLIGLTTDLVRVPGVNPPGDEGPRAAVLAGACRDRGFDVSEHEVAPGRPNLRAVLPGGPGPGLLLLGHTDVVPVGDGWTLDPFGGELREGRIHGRGATDMLGGLAACVVAMDAIRRAGVALSGPVELAALVDEEETGLGIRAHTSELVAAGRSFVGCLVAEPTDLQTIVAARGDSYLEYDVLGVAAHSGSPSDGRNAITGASRIVADLAAWHDELAPLAHPLVGPPTWSVGMINGGQSTSTVAADCHLSVDRRLLPGEDPDEVLAAVRARLDGLDLAASGLRATVEMTMAMPGFETGVDHPFAIAADRSLQDAGGPGLEPAGWTAACDGGFIARDLGAPVVVQGPGSVTDQAHRPDESVGVGELLVAARAYALLVLRTLAV